MPDGTTIRLKRANQSESNLIYVSNVCVVICYCISVWGFPGGSVVKSPPANAGDVGDSGLIPRLTSSLEAGHDHPLQYSCLENPMDRGAWWVTGHRVTKVRYD